MSKLLLTGAHGFTGRYVLPLLKKDYEVLDVSFSSGISLSDPKALNEVVEDFQPNFVIHLAAVSFVGHGSADEVYQTNLIGTRNLLEAVSKYARNLRRVILASSANVYGNQTEGMLDELTPFSPANDYAVSKVSMEYLAGLYKSRFPIVITRPFNYTGVGQAEYFLVPKIIKHIREKVPVIELGNVDVARDFSDVRSIAEIYRGLLTIPDIDGEIFNICSGKPYSLKDILTMAMDISGHSMEVQVNPAFVRQNDVKILVGDPGKLKKLLPDLPTWELRDTLEWMVNT